MYKNTAVFASAPQRKDNENRRKGTNSGEESEGRQAKYKMENVTAEEDEMNMVQRRKSIH